MLVRQAIGLFCGGAGLLFLVINAGILSRGAAKWGFEYWEKISYGAVAATVPFVIASMPLLVQLSWRRGKRFGYPSLLTIVACVIWLVFVTYNLAGAAGSIALVRDDVVSSRKFIAHNLEADEGMRARLTGELDAIPRHRPAGTVAPLIAAAKAQAEWERTEKCTDIRRSKDKKFCDALTGMESELASARQAQDLTARLAAINAKLESKGPASEKADPAARIIASLTGWDEGLISDRLPLATPIILELGSMTLIYFGIVFSGIGTHADLAHTRLRTAVFSQAALPPGNQALIPAVTRATLTRQRELAEWFFRECVRPMASGNMPEADWYRHYTEVCRDGGDVPLPVTSFRRFAEKCPVLTVSTVENVTYYLGALPYVPRRVAS